MEKLSMLIGRVFENVKVQFLDTNRPNYKVHGFGKVSLSFCPDIYHYSVILVDTEVDRRSGICLQDLTSPTGKFSVNPDEPNQSIQLKFEKIQTSTFLGRAYDLLALEFGKVEDYYSALTYVKYWEPRFNGTRKLPILEKVDQYDWFLTFLSSFPWAQNTEAQEKQTKKAHQKSRCRCSKNPVTNDDFHTAISFLPKEIILQNILNKKKTSPGPCFWLKDLANPIGKFSIFPDKSNQSIYLKFKEYQNIPMLYNRLAFKFGNPADYSSALTYVKTWEKRINGNGKLLTLEKLEKYKPLSMILGHSQEPYDAPEERSSFSKYVKQIKSVFTKISL